MSTGIKPRKTFDNRSQSKYARRYLFYPLKDIDFFKTQYASPVYTPVFPKAEIVLLEAFPYLVPTVGDSNGEIAGMDEQIMGTDAQVKFIMGNADSGYMSSGMAYLDHLTDVDPEVVIEIQDFIFPNRYKPETLVELGEYLPKRLLEAEVPHKDLIKQTIEKLIESVNIAKTHCLGKINEIEAEINDSKTGKKLAMKSGLDAGDLYLYNQIGRALPEEKSGVNMAQELGKILAGAIGAPQLDPQKDLENEMNKRELEALRKEVEEKDKLIQELAGYETESA
jgi:hypothetical protein